MEGIPIMSNHPSQSISRWQETQQEPPSPPEKRSPLNQTLVSSSKAHALIKFWKNLGLIGTSAIVTGISIPLCFSLPWLSPTSPDNSVNSGWGAALGLPNSHFLEFPYLWLIPLSACGMLALAWLLSTPRLAPGFAAALLCTCSSVALLAELICFAQTKSLQTYLEALPLHIQADSLLYGFWLTGAASAAALGAGLWTIRASGPREQDCLPDERISFWKKLGRTGQAGCLVSLASLGCFLLPWYSTPDFAHPMIHTQQQPTAIYAGWETAAGWSGAPPGTYLYLWLIPLSVGGMLVVFWFLGKHQIETKQAITIIIILAAVALLVQVGFFIEVTLLESVREAVYQTNGYGVLWGFWLAGVIFITLGAAGIRALKPHIPPPDIETSAC
jgi:hypothetical protein